MEEAVQTAVEEIRDTNLSVGGDTKLSIQGKDAFVCFQLVVAKRLLLHIASSIQSHSQKKLLSKVY